MGLWPSVVVVILYYVYQGWKAFTHRVAPEGAGPSPWSHGRPNSFDDNEVFKKESKLSAASTAASENH